MGTSRIVEYSPGTVSPGTDYAVSYPSFDSEDEHSCLNSNRTLRMNSHCSSCSSIEVADFLQFPPDPENPEHAWLNPLQLILLAHEFYYASFVQAPTSCLVVDPSCPPPPLHAEFVIFVWVFQ
eukprot:5727790-Amphidinium_carterae.1